MMDLLWLILGLTLLVFSGDWIVKGAASLAFKLNVPKIVVGMTVVSFGTSLPELLVSMEAAANGHPEIAIGNVFGSNIANLGLVLGISLLLNPIAIQKRNINIDGFAMLLSTFLLGWVIYDQQIVWYEGAILFASLIVFTIYLYRSSKSGKLKLDLEEVEDEDKWTKIAIYNVLGLVGLYYGADWLVESAVNIARKLDVSDRVIATSMVAFGTSVPELATSVIAAVKKESDISIGNLLGSNIFNILAVLGFTGMFHVVPVSNEALFGDYYWVLGIAFLVLVMMKLKDTLYFKSGIILLLLYVTYMYFLIF